MPDKEMGDAAASPAPSGEAAASPAPSGEMVRYVDDSGRFAVGTVGEVVQQVETTIESSRTEENQAVKLDKIHNILFDIISISETLNKKIDIKMDKVIGEIKLTRAFFGEETGRLSGQYTALEKKLDQRFDELKQDNERNYQALRSQMTLLLDRISNNP